MLHSSFEYFYTNYVNSPYKHDERLKTNAHRVRSAKTQQQPIK